MTTKKTGNVRLLKLAKFLRALPPSRFDYNVWVGGDWAGADDLSCGTTACALGWATVVPDLRRTAGLRLMKSRTGTAFVTLKKWVGSRKHNRFRASMDAAEEVFALDTGEAVHLFTPLDSEIDATPKRVADKIEQFVARRT